jgi:hypothetical protein
MVPLLWSGFAEMVHFDLVEEAISKGNAKITETTEGGEVPFLKIENKGDCPILILEGEELVGGKQNRVVNTTVVVLAGSTLEIPVSCMEAGRWDYRRKDFDSGEALFRAKSRAVQKESVMASLCADLSYRSDQGAVWNEVRQSLEEVAAPSATSDYRAGRERVAHRIEDFVAALNPVEGQIGAIFVSAAGLLGLELLRASDLFAKCAGKIVRSFAFEVISSGDSDHIRTDDVAPWWEKISDIPLSTHPAPGAGEIVRLDTSDVIGSGLCWNTALVHFSCFPAVGSTRGKARTSSHRATASQRRERMMNK